MSETVGGPLPEFARPPVIEVALSIQFDALEELRTPQIGLLWSQFRDRYPHAEEHPPIQPKIEQFGVRIPAESAVGVRLMETPETLRCWFLNEAGNRLIQVQKDRFILNWRKSRDEDQYPRYGPIKEQLRHELKIFEEYLTRERLGELKPNQCELTYVNHILPGEGWANHGEADKVFTMWSNAQSVPFLPHPDDIRFTVRYVIPDRSGDPRGRLNVSLQPAFLKRDDKPIFVLTLIARGQPGSRTIEEALNFLNIGHVWIVRGFTAMTTPVMHRIWGRLNGGGAR